MKTATGKTYSRVSALQRARNAVLPLVALVFAASMCVPAMANPVKKAGPKQRTAQAMPNTVIEITAVAPGQLLIEYRLPPGQTSATFIDPRPELHQAVRQRMMRPLDACAHLEEERLVLDRPGCRAARFLVSAGPMVRDALYEAAQPVSDGSVISYVPYFGVTVPGAGLTWSLRGPRNGYVLYEGQEGATREIRLDAAAVARGLAHRDTPDGYRMLHAADYAYFGVTPIQREGGTRWIADPRLPVAVRDEIAKVATVATQALTQASGQAPRRSLTVIMTASLEDGGRQRGVQMHGDVTDTSTMRLTFRNPNAKPSERDLFAWRKFVAHEFVHVWNGRVYSTDSLQPWLAEGQAEWLSLSLLREAALISPEQQREALESAYNLCMLSAGDRAWAANATSQRGQDRYTCGLSLHWLADAGARLAEANPTPALARWGAQVRRAPHLDHEAFLAYYVAPASREAARAALTGEAPLRDTLRRWIDASGVMFADASTPPTPMIAAYAAQRVFVPLGEADCREWGFWPEAQGLRIDPQAKCKHLVAGALVQSIAGVPMPAQAGFAADRVRAACANGSTVAVQLDDGRSLDLACPAEAIPRLSFIRLLAPAEPVRATANPGSRS